MMTIEEISSKFAEIKEFCGKVLMPTISLDITYQRCTVILYPRDRNGHLMDSVAYRSFDIEKADVALDFLRKSAEDYFNKEEENIKVKMATLQERLDILKAEKGE